MKYYADLHIHSKYSRATSKECDLENLALWARRKGIALAGTGDFTHPAWFDEIKSSLVPAEPGLFRLKKSVEKEVDQNLDPALRGPTRFCLSVEISTIYKRDGKTRKVHHVIMAPSIDAAGKIRKTLGRIGNIKSDGRPILGLDSRDLLEITLEAGEGAVLIPAHIWTPWFSALGSKSGFDSIEECYADLAPHIFAVETGLSSDPPMNWKLSSLDRYRLVSNSDAHSPMKLGREACVFDCDLDYFSMIAALETGEGYDGTVEMFPEEGKYHLDGHRKCGCRLEPAETRDKGGRCPRCGKPLTLGVLYRVEELADRTGHDPPPAAGPFKSFIPLNEIVGEILGRGPNTKGVMKSFHALLSRIGPELFILGDAPAEDIARHGSEEIAEAIGRMRQGKVIREAGYDGEYGVIKLFEKGELSGKASAGMLFDLPDSEKQPRKRAKKDGGGGGGGGGTAKGAAPSAKAKAGKAPAKKSKARKGPEKDQATGGGALAGLDPGQLEAARVVSGPVLIMAGPGTGKTRTLAARVAHAVQSGAASADKCLAVTFTRRAAAEMSERLSALLGETASTVSVMTFHGLGHEIVRSNVSRLGLRRKPRVLDEAERRERLARALDAAGQKSGKRAVGRVLAALSELKRKGERPAPLDPLVPVFDLYEAGLREEALADFDDLIGLSTELLDSDPGALAECRERWSHVSVDEFQDIDPLQYRLVRLLCPAGSDVMAIGDPDQSIYGFRGSDVSIFGRFVDDYPGARVFTLKRNYRSNRVILEASAQMIAPSSLAQDRELEALLDAAEHIHIQSAPTDLAEAEFIVHTIERLLGGSGFFSMDSGRVDYDDAGGYTPADFAVLYRTERQAGPIARALDRSGIPFQKRSHERLAELPGVAAVLAALGETAEADERMGDDLAAALQKAAGRARDMAAADDIESALSLLLPLAAEHAGDLDGFRSALALESGVDSLDPRAERVSLLTLHASKGLEYRVVFIAGCEDGLLPLRFGSKEAADPAEERRLLFVGMTRAMDRLYLCHAAKRTMAGQSREMEPSPFLRDIGEGLIERSKGGGKRKRAPEGPRQLDLF